MIIDIGKSSTITTKSSQYVRVVQSGDFRLYRRSQLHNRYVHIEKEVIEAFTRRVETDILETKCKVYDVVVPRILVYPVQESNVINLFNRSIQWLYRMNESYNILLSLNYSTVVDSSFFLENPDIILAY